MKRLNFHESSYGKCSRRASDEENVALSPFRSFFCGVNRGRCPDLNASADLTEIFDLSPEAVLYSVMRIAKAGRRIARTGRSVLVLRLSADSRRIHATGGNGRMGSVLIDPDALLIAAAPIAGRELSAAEINNFILNGSAR